VFVGGLQRVLVLFFFCRARCGTGYRGRGLLVQSTSRCVSISWAIPQGVACLWVAHKDHFFFFLKRGCGTGYGLRVKG